MGENSKRDGLSSVMGSPPAEFYDEWFLRELLCTGSRPRERFSDLGATLPTDAWSDEEPVPAVFEMLCGTIGAALPSADSRDLQRATELIDLAGARIEPAQLAHDMSPRIDGDDGSVGRTYA